MKMRASATPMLTLTVPTSLSPSLLFFHRRKPSFLFSNPKPFLFLLHHSSTVSSSSSSSSFRLRCSSSTSHSQSISESESEDGVCIEIKKLPNNSRRILSSVAINASLLAVWNVLTDYEGLADFIPGLAISQLLDRGPDYARLFQVGEQNLALGLKFNAKGVVDCYEKPLEILPSAQKREIEFNMVDGDFQLFQGKWSILQHDSGGEDQEMNTTLSYLVDVQPKLWLPVQLVEGRLSNEIKLSCGGVKVVSAADCNGSAFSGCLSVHITERSEKEGSIWRSSG
ncbi:hypothetical protein G4B88_030841 [Cannabis sativa]|uniref:Coenzyme Q-binding protein COQ10 START domain-containing protein n=1 Tax=Cannabis sativa TaxID=3483 RepID=A0A7J6FM78_CANSA|nr:hypothetical protein G4B88_030841 [Cannabis sativa]